MPPLSKTLPPEPASAGAARRYVTKALHERGRDAFSDLAEVLVSELVTNAILHARTEFTIVLDVHADGVRVSVTDSSRAGAVRRSYSESATTGRGLALVEALAADWGSEQVDAGKRVWFELRESMVAA